MNKILGVWWDVRKVGRLQINEHGELQFSYELNWLSSDQATPVSHSLPLREEPFDRRETRPFFAGLLPEADIKKRVARALQLSEQNDFGLLQALGGDVAGALTLWPDGQVPPPPRDQSPAKPLTDKELLQRLDELPRRPLLAGEVGIRLSLAGAQYKLPVVLVEGRIALPVPGQPSTHILKPPIRYLDHSTENEAYAMRLANAVGLDVAPVAPMHVKDRPFLLVTRYDRVVSDGTQTARLHQEDFCQAMGVTPEHKYAAEGGPTFKTSFDLVRSAASRPAVETLKLLDAAIYNLVVGNADAHGKNYSLLYRSGGTTLAPLYDLMCTMAYPDLASNLAMKFAQASDLDEFRPSTWGKFAADIKIGVPFLRRRVRELAQSSYDQATSVADRIAEEGFNKEVLRKFCNIVKERAERVATTPEC